MRHTRDMRVLLPTREFPPNLYASRAGIAELAKGFDRALTGIKATGSRRQLTDIKHEVYIAFQECARHEISPPQELVDVLKRVLEIGDEENRRNRLKFPLGRISFIKERSRLSGHALARELRACGIAIADRTVAAYERKGII